MRAVETEDRDTHVSVQSLLLPLLISAALAKVLLPRAGLGICPVDFPNPHWISPYSYIWHHIDIGYVQGMCDLLAPLLVILDDGERDGFLLFCDFFVLVWVKPIPPKAGGLTPTTCVSGVGHSVLVRMVL